MTVESAILSEDGKTVTLIMADALKNQTQYELTFNNVKEAVGSKIVSVYKYKFTPVDAQLPVVEKVEALGNKTIKVTFNEPVINPTTASFLLDGKVLLGYSNVVGRTLIVKTYATLTNGEHKITVKDVADYSGLKSLSKEIPFVVVEDTVAPTILNVIKATFEVVVLQFSEPVDPATVKGSNIYWMQGTTKKTAANTAYQLTDDIFAFDFSTNRVQYATEIYVTGVKDYSGNVIADKTKVLVTPVLDTTRPEIINAELESLNEITVKFSKRVQKASAEKAANYVIKDSDGEIVSKLKTVTLATDGKTVAVKLNQSLYEGETYTFEIAGVADDTTLNNVMLPYTTTFETEDETKPSVSSVTYNNVNGANTIIVTFDEQMAISGDGSIVDPSKYMYKKDGMWKSLPTTALLNVSSDGMSVLITFPTTIAVTTITEFRIQLVKDVTGNYLAGLTTDETPVAALRPTVSYAQAKGTTTIRVIFDRELQANTIDANDFEVVAGTTKLDVVDATQLAPYAAHIVVLTLAGNSKLKENGKYGPTDVPVDIVVKSNATTSTADGKTITGTSSVVDKIKATVKGINGSADGKSIEVEFNEKLLAVSLPAEFANIATDFVIYNDLGSLLNSKDDYSVAAITDNKVTINFTASQAGVMTIAIENPRFLKDANNNVVAAMAETEVAPDEVAPTASLGTSFTATSLDVNFSEGIDTLVINSTTVTEKITQTFVKGSNTANFTIDNLGATDAQTIVFTITDLAGNSKAYKATFDLAGTTWTIVAK